VQVRVTLNWSKLRQDLLEPSLGLVDAARLVRQYLGPPTEEAVLELGRTLKAACGSVEEVEQRATDRALLGIAAEVETHMKAMLAAVCSRQPAGQRQAHVKAAVKW
jgi:hypothetical protein